MGFIVAIIIGGVIGWLASLIMKTNAQMGLIANIVVGVVGSLIGHWGAGALGIAAAGTLPSPARPSKVPSDRPSLGSTTARTPTDDPRGFSCGDDRPDGG